MKDWRKYVTDSQLCTSESINGLKKKRKNLRKTTTRLLRLIGDKHGYVQWRRRAELNALIHGKQSLYFSRYQFVNKFRWSMLDRSRNKNGA